MKKLVFLVLLLSTFCNINAQDKIIKKDGQKIDAIIDVIRYGVISYKEFYNQKDGLKFIAQDSVASIIYFNGKQIVYDVIQNNNDNQFIFDTIQKNELSNKYYAAKSLRIPETESD